MDQPLYKLKISDLVYYTVESKKQFVGVERPGNLRFRIGLTNERLASVNTRLASENTREIAKGQTQINYHHCICAKWKNCKKI